MREKACTLGKQHMLEVNKVLSIDEFFTDSDTHPHEERMRVAEMLISHKIVLRKIYLKYSMILVNNPEKAFQMSRASSSGGAPVSLASSSCAFQAMLFQLLTK